MTVEHLSKELQAMIEAEVQRRVATYQRVEKQLRQRLDYLIDTACDECRRREEEAVRQIEAERKRRHP